MANMFNHQFQYLIVMKIKLPSRICLFLMMGIIASVATVQANPISRQRALQNANKFLLQRDIGVEHAALKQAAAFKGDGTTEEAPYHVFNIGDGNGFVIASGDDCAYEILGYSDKGTFDADKIPDGLKYMLDCYAKEIGYGSKSPNVAAPKSSPSYPAVEPLLTTEWGQEEPFNDNCPISQSTGERCVTGCIATAMAQVMYYHRNHHSTREVVNDIPSSIPQGSPIDWDNMLDAYDTTATDVQRQAVANLMLYCGISTKMRYGPISSTAYITDVIPALVNYFDYYDDASLKSRYDYTDLEWETLVYEELGAGFPVYYSASQHAFVVDGHDGNGFVHINWGWAGTDDGHFRLTATSGSGESMGGYNSGERALFGVAPNGFIHRLTTTELSLTSSDVVENLSSLTSIPVTLAMTVTNLTEETGTLEQAVGLYKLGDLQSVVSPIRTFDGMAPGTARQLSVSLELESTLSPGIYTLVPISRVPGPSLWRRNSNYDQFITVTIYGDSAHLTVGMPQEQGDTITFADDRVRRVCVNNWDLNGDGVFSKQEAATVPTLGQHFRNNSLITSFDELQYFTGLTRITHEEFNNCSMLASIILPPNIMSIEDNAFYKCSKLQHITIPKSVTSIGTYVFAHSTELTAIQVENGNPVYDSRNNCNAIIETATNQLVVGICSSVIPNDVVAIDPYAFIYCDGLESIQIPASVTSIGKYAFSSCSRLATINIGEGVTSIDENAFSYCSALTQVTIPSSVTSMGHYVFCNCSGLKSVNFLASMNNISPGTFLYCTGLTSFTLSRSVTCIGEYAFGHCRGMTSLTIPSSVTHIANRAFEDCTSLTSVTIPSGVTYIGYGAFADCTLLTSVTIAQSVDSIDGNPFYGCPKLQSVVVDSLNPYYHSDDNNRAVIETATKTLVIGLANTVIPDDVVAIGAYAFSNCSGLTSIVLPDGVTSIGYCAFRQCYKLQSINIPSGVTSIGDGAFQVCYRLTSINIPYGVTSIGRGAFNGCSNLAAITIPSTVTSIGGSAFWGCGFTSIKSYIKNVYQTGENAFMNCSNATLYVPQGLVDVYRATEDWNRIRNIEEMPVILDVNGDGSVNIVDVSSLIDRVLGSPSDEGCAYDVNNDEQVNIADVSTLIDALLSI